MTSVLVFLPLPPPLPGWQRSPQRAPGPHLSGRGDGGCQPHYPGTVPNRRGDQRHQDGVPGGRMNSTGPGIEEGDKRRRSIKDGNPGGVGCWKETKIMLLSKASESAPQPAPYPLFLLSRPPPSSPLQVIFVNSNYPQPHPHLTQYIDTAGRNGSL